MKKIKVLSFLTAVSLAACIWFSCKPDSLLKPVPPEMIARIENLGLEDYNKSLLLKLFSGDLNDKNGKKVAAFNVSLWREMLNFKSKEDYKNYFKALNALKERWDYKDKLGSTNDIKNPNPSPTLRDEGDGEFESIENLGDDALNAVEAAYGLYIAQTALRSFRV